MGTGGVLGNGGHTGCWRAYWVLEGVVHTECILELRVDLNQVGSSILWVLPPLSTWSGERQFLQVYVAKNETCPLGTYVLIYCEIYSTRNEKRVKSRK